ncbi:hypothetical protein PIB30_027171 [Stylosanthes scabra]|uniref:Uncharacterized protein n=1 Tax=Stylosanthes scabra TaxID=79078 RepID=A0ABU6QBF9_9FABA|nr:hypothetical protein [Stylosanthes scabra]
MGMEQVLPIYALMENEPMSFLGIITTTMNDDRTDLKNQLLPFPMFITTWAEKAKVLKYSGDDIIKIPKSQQFFPFGKWKGEEEAVKDPIPPPMPSPLPSPAMHTDIPTSSTFSSPEPSLSYGYFTIGANLFSESFSKLAGASCKVSSMEGVYTEDDDEFQSAEVAAETGADDESDGDTANE